MTIHTDARAVVDPGFSKGGEGHKIMDLRTHIYIITKTTRWEVVKNSASPKRHFFVVFPQSSEHFHSRSYANIHSFYTCLATHTSFFHFFSLRPHPPLFHVPEMSPPLRSTYGWGKIPGYNTELHYKRHLFWFTCKFIRRG